MRRLLLPSLLVATLSAGSAFGQPTEEEPIAEQRVEIRAEEPARVVDETKPSSVPVTGTPEGSSASKDEPEIDVPRKPAVQLGPKHIRLHLLDGSVISGDLSVSEITVDTSFGKLVVPIEKLRSFTPGLDSYPQKVAELEGLINSLGSDDYKTREQAHKDLAALGPKIQNELAKHANDENAEIKRHVGEILKELETQAEESGDDEESVIEQPWIRLDTIVTSDFTVIGKVSPAEFTIESKYGPLNVKLADVNKAERDAGAKESLRKNITVGGENIAQRTFKSTGIRVEAGDKIYVRAEGTVVMTPWGSNSASGPDGATNYGWYVPNQIPGGALVARIGDKGQVFKVGAKSTFTAKQSGVLQMAIGIQPEYANEGYQYPGEYRVKLRIEPK